MINPPEKEYCENKIIIGFLKQRHLGKHPAFLPFVNNVKRGYGDFIHKIIGNN